MFIWFRFNAITKPVVVIEDKPDQVIVRFIPYGAERITVHKKSDGTLIKNYSLAHVAEPIWENDAGRIARQCYKYWKKHLKYAFAHQPLVKIENENGYHLISKRINLNIFNPNDKYKRYCDSEVTVPSPTFMLNLYLSTSDNPRSEAGIRFKTSFGDLCLELNK